MSSKLNELWSIAFSKRCVLCQFKYKGKHAICESCFYLLPRLSHPCHGCATPMLGSSLEVCHRCLTTSRSTDHLMINYPFIEPLRSLIHTFKFHQGLYLTSLLATLMLYRGTPMHLPELLIPVPLHPKRQALRGFNQAALLTNYLSRQLNIPHDLWACKKVRDTLPQSGYSASLRYQNLIDAFEVKALPYQHVALIDDVLTTGATVNHLASLLKQTGVARVDVWCIAKTVMS